jgi:hypothetical protein
VDIQHGSGAEVALIVDARKRVREGLELCARGPLADLMIHRKGRTLGGGRQCAGDQQEWRDRSGLGTICRQAWSGTCQVGDVGCGVMIMAVPKHSRKSGRPVQMCACGKKPYAWLAGRIRHWLKGEHPLHAQWDAGVYLALRQIRANSGYGRLLGEVLSSWPAAHRIKWVRAFGRTWHVADRPQRILHLSQNSPRRDSRHALRQHCPPVSGTRQRPLPLCNRDRRVAKCHKRRIDLLHCTKAFDR